LWQGIEIHGTSSDQLQANNMQGIVELKNGAIIENAHIGVLVGFANSSENRGGGILTAQDAKFIDCVTGVEYKPYTRYDYYFMEVSNKSSFKNCEFVWNNNMIEQTSSVLSYSHVILSNIGKITFSGCRFLNNKFNNKNTQGIYAYNAGADVTAIMSLIENISDNVEVGQRGYFKNFTYGIYYAHSGQNITPNPQILLNRKLAVIHCDFIGNVQGIFNTNAHNSTIKHNYFEPGNITSIPNETESLEDFVNIKGGKSIENQRLGNLITVPVFNNIFGVGINLDASTGYVIQNNTFTQINTGIPHCTGIHVNNSGGSPNKIDNNHFEFLQCGILSNGYNKADNSIDGLQILCNTFSERCQYAISINTPSGIALWQGSPAKAAGNTFSHSNRPVAGNIYSTFTNPLYYYYNRNISEENPLQEYVTPIFTLLNPVNQSANCGFEQDWQEQGPSGRVSANQTNGDANHLEILSAETALELEYISRQRINLYLADTASAKNHRESIIQILEQLPGIEAVYEVADIYANMQRFDLVYNKMNTLLHSKLSEREREEVETMKSWYHFIESHSTNTLFVDTLSRTDVEILKKLAKTSTKAGSRAKSMLYYYSGCTYHHHVEPEFPDFESQKILQTSQNSEESQEKLYDNQELYHNKVSVYPNPTETHATFTYNFQSEIKNCVLQIFDNKGMNILSISLDGNSGNYIWDTRGVSSGLYTYLIVSDDKKLNGGKIVIQK